MRHQSLYHFLDGRTFGDATWHRYVVRKCSNISSPSLLSWRLAIASDSLHAYITPTSSSFVKYPILDSYNFHFISFSFWWISRISFPPLISFLFSNVWNVGCVDRSSYPSKSSWHNLRHRRIMVSLRLCPFSSPSFSLFFFSNFNLGRCVYRNGLYPATQS